MKLSSPAVAFGILLIGAAPVTAQDAYVEQVNTQIVEAAATLMADGYVRTHDAYTSALNHGEFDEITIDLQAGTEYVILGVCDEDCYDLDLFLSDSGGNLIDSDTEIDDVPLVAFTPSRSGEFVVEIEMVDCEVGPCALGIGVFGR